MNWKWRALAGTILLAGAVVWLPMAVSTSAETRYNTSNTVVRGPASDNAEDNDSGDNGSSDNNNNNDNSSSSSNNNDTNDNSSGNNNSNNNNNDNSGNGGNTPPPQNANPPANAPGQNGALTVGLDVSNNFKPVVNAPFRIAITGSGAPIDQLILTVDGGGPDAGPNNDDLAHIGTQTFACNGANPCSTTWNVVARNAGYYNIHAQARDTSGNVAQIDSNVLVSENPRN